ncbi:MAG: hypothetical protein AB2608_19270 [Candidatus Thiodiazotropha sp.]
MTDKNVTEGAAHPQEATDETQANSSSNFNKFISLENDRLRVELEQQAEDKKALETAAALEFAQIGKAFIGFAGEINLVTYFLLDEWSTLQERLSELHTGIEAETLQEAIERFDNVLHGVRKGHDEIAEYLVTKGDEFAAKTLSDSAEQVIRSYSEMAIQFEDMKKQLEETQTSRAMYHIAMQKFINDWGVEINE